MNVSMKIGARLRRARKIKKLTLKELAELAQCSESLLSKVENDRITPSLQMLHRIASHLNTSIGELMENVSGEEAVVLRKGERALLELEQNQSGIGAKIEWLIPRQSTHLLSAGIHIVVPGAGSQGPIFHDGEEIGYVLEGELSLTVNGTTYIVREGDSFFFSSDLPHEYENTGTVTARVLWTNTPATF